KWSHKPSDVIIGCRDIQKGENAAQDIRIKNPKADIIVMKLDLSSLSSVRHFAKSVAKQLTKVDILINNAGVMMCPESTTDEGFELQLVSNYLGHFLLNHCLMPLLKKSTKARIVNLSSICHILGKIHFDNINLKNGVYRPMKAYSQSKLAIILSTQEMSRRLGTDSSVTVYSLHPGVIQTEITRHFPLYLYLFLKPFMVSIETGTQTTLYCALEESIENESGFYYENCQRLDNMVSQAIDAKNAQKLWDLSSDLVQLEDQLKIK
ncbi:unnamed protein product, partial [Medioppia subpectinata]